MAENGLYIIEDNNEFLKIIEDLQKQYLEHANAGANENVKK